MNELQLSLSKCNITGNTLFLPPISEGALKNYNEVRNALLKAGATYKKNSFVFPSDAQPYIDRLMGGEKVNIKKEFQFFGTPDTLADDLVKLADIQVDDEVCEPSAGQGAIVKAIQRATRRQRPVYGYELMEMNRTVLEGIEGLVLLGSDFLDCTYKFHKIVANPPFSKNQDITHVMKMYGCLKAGGRLVSVTSTHWKNSSNKKETEFREWIEKIGATIKEVPAGTFKESGTNIPSLIVVINKK